MPAARGQSAEDGAASCVFVEVERLRIEFRRERLDALLADGDPARAVDLAHGEVLEIFFAHVSDLLCSGHISGPNHAVRSARSRLPAPMLVPTIATRGPPSPKTSGTSRYSRREAVP